jgi:hypothetical protein
MTTWSLTTAAEYEAWREESIPGSLGYAPTNVTMFKRVDTSR